MKLSDYIIHFLQDKGIKRIYGVTGGAVMHIVDSVRKSDIEFIPMLHEQGAGIAAEGESILTNEPAVLLTTAGPGITNAITAINSAWIDGNPLLILSGQCKTDDMINGRNLRQKGIQEVEAVKILKQITKYSSCIYQSQGIKYDLEKVFYFMTHGRKGPCFLEFPLDIQNTEIDEDELIGYFSTDNGISNEFNNKIDKLIELLNNSKKPVILAGNGIRQSDAYDIFRNLIEFLDLPILLTWKSKDFLPKFHMLNYDSPGSIAPRYSNEILQECDLLISIGVRIDLPTCAFDYSSFAKNAKKVIVDIDQAEIDKLEFDKELIFHCDAKIFIEKFKQKIFKIFKDYHKTWLNWVTECYMLKDQKYSICLPEYYEETEYVNPYAFIDQLGKVTKDDDIIVAASSGSASEMMAQAYQIKGTQRFISSNGLGSMGFGICHSIGVSFASNKERRVVLVEGDGSFFMNSHHLQTIAQHKLPIVMFVGNNNGYKSIRDTHTKFFGETLACDKESGLELPDLEKVANSYNIEYFKIEDNECLYLLESYIFKANLPIIVEVMVDPEFATQPKVQSYVDEDGKMCSGKLENMWPFEK